MSSFPDVSEFSPSLKAWGLGERFNPGKTRETKASRDTLFSLFY